MILNKTFLISNFSLHLLSNLNTMKKIILLIISIVFYTLQAQVPQSERDALIAIYNATNGASWNYASNWNTSNPVNTWNGITVNNINGEDHVTEVELFYNNLSGNIPTEIGNLTQLTKLTVTGNQGLSGNIPIEIGNLTQLTDLDLNFNNLSGNIPTEIGNLTQLTNLDLGSNALSGSIPTEIGNLSNLIYLDLSGNQLSGTIPTEITTLSNLEYLVLTGNQLSGTIPTEINNLLNLTYLNLGTNQLSGEILPQIGDLINLGVLSLDANQLTGNIPTEIGNLVNLNTLHLDNNLLTGDVPDIFNDMADLHSISLRNNELTGNVNLSHNSNLRHVYMHEMQISSIDFRNGNNGYIIHFGTSDNQTTDEQNPNLTCIYVDDKNASFLSDWHLGSNTHFVEDQTECETLSLDESYLQDIEIYPNPFTDNITIKIANEANIKNINIQNIQGQTIYKSVFMPQVNLSNLTSGVYFLNFENEQGYKTTYKLIKQ